MNKVIKILICIIFIPLLCRILFLIISSCVHDYSEPIWQPYQVGDSAVYSNNKGDTVKLSIFKIENCSNPSDPLLVLNHRIYSTFVCSLDDTNSIIHIRTESGEKVIDFEPPFRRGTIKVVEPIEIQENITAIKYRNRDIFKITPHSTDLRIKPCIDSIFWSSKLGYIKVFYSNGECWELNSFSRDGDVLYDIHKEL